MSNNSFFYALSSGSRIKILKRLLKEEVHLSCLSRDLDISKPVVSRHLKILEKAGLIKRRVIGNVHVFSANLDVLDKAFDPFVEESDVEISEDGSILDALRQLPNVEVKRRGKNQFITSIDGEEGFYIYEVDGSVPDKPIDEFKPKKDVTLKVKKLVPVDKKKVNVGVKDKKEK